MTVNIQNLLNVMGHLQTPTIIKTDNSTTAGFVNKNVMLKQSKAWDMNLHWMRDRERRKQFLLQWHAGKGNRANYFTKTTFSIKEHKDRRPTYVKDEIRNCIEKLNLLYIIHE